MNVKKESIFCKSLLIVITMTSSIILIYSGVNMLPYERKIKEINILSSSNNTYSYNINFEDCNYFTTQQWSNLNDINEFLKTNYNINDNYNIKRYGSNNYYCNFSDETSKTTSIITIILGVLTYCFSIFMLFIALNNNNEKNIMLLPL